MAWLSRPASPPAGDRAAQAAQPEPIEGASPGIAAVLQGTAEGQGRAVLDLGPASNQSLQVYGRFARWIYFADLLGEPLRPRAEGAPVGLQLAKFERPYDFVFAWDILDRLFPEDRAHLVRWLVDSTAPQARVHVVIRSSDDAIAHPLRFTVVDNGHIRYEPAGTTRLPLARLLPAEVAKVLAPLRVAHAFTLKNGLREYMAVRP